MSGIDSDLIRGHIDTIILKTLFDGDKYGYEILDEVAKKSGGAYELKQPTLYSCLKRLETQGLISSYWVDSEIGGKRHYYCLTDQGKETYIDNQKNWLRSRQIIDNLIWEDATHLPDRDVITERTENTYNSEELITNSPAENSELSDDISENHINEANQEVEQLDNVDSAANKQPIEDESNLSSDNSSEEPVESNDSKEINETPEELMISEENSTESFNSESEMDIMALLGHYEPNEVEETIEKLEEANEDLNDLDDGFSTNAFLDHFAKTYMHEESELTAPDINNTEENQAEEVSDDFNLDITKYLLTEDSYFASTDTKDKIDFITPNIVIDKDVEEKTEDSSHIEFVDDDELYTQEEITNEEETVQEFIDTTPTYLSFGEEIERKQEVEDTAYSYIEDDSIYGEDYSLSNYNTENTSFDESITTIDNNEYGENNDQFTPDESFNQIIEKNVDEVEHVKSTVKEFTQENYTNKTEAFEPIPQKYTDEVYKKKLTELTTFAKESSVLEEEQKEINTEILFDTDEFLKRSKATKNYDKLISDFESEGLSVRVHQKLVKESKDTRTYIQTNKIKMTRNWISFSFIAAILAIVFAVMSQSNTTVFGFSYKYFVIGISIAMLVPIISTLIYAINPYRKNVAKYSPGVSFMLSGLVFIQLLLIVYCVNLQLGFYSFTQEYYNHLFWIIPSIISIYPILNSIIYASLYKSKNFHS